MAMTKKARDTDMDVMSGSEGPLDKPFDKKMLEVLRLSPSQKKRASALRGPHPRRTKVVDRIRRDSRGMLDLYKNYDLDESKARRLIESIHASQVELGKINLERVTAVWG